MASFDSYANLQTTILAWLARPGDTNITAADLITLFEEEARDRLRTRFGETNGTLTTSAGVQTVATPSLFESHRELVLQTSPTVFLEYITPEIMDSTYVDGSTGAPEFFTIKGTNFYFAPTPDAVYTIDIDYLAGIPALNSSTQTTNWLLTNYPSTYLFGALAEAESFIGNDERIALWIQRRDAALQRLIDADIRNRWSGGVLTIRTDTGNP